MQHYQTMHQFARILTKNQLISWPTKEWKYKWNLGVSKNTMPQIFAMEPEKRQYLYKVCCKI